MKNFKIVLFVAAFFATNVGNIAYSQAQLSCSTLRTNNDTPSNGNMECKTTPTSLIFKIYELSLCTAAATPLNQDRGPDNPCTKLFNDVNGADIDLTAGGVSIPLGSIARPDDGRYTHALLKIDVNILMTTKFQFAASRTADNATTGAFCFSNGSDISSDPASGLSHISCGSAFPRNVTASRDSIKLIGTERSGFQMNQEIGLRTTLDGVTSVTDLYILDSDGTQSSGDLTYTGSAPNLTAVLTGSDRKFIMASQLLGSRLTPTPVVISPSTNNVELSMLVTDSSSIGFDASNGNLFDNGFNGLIIQISSN